jgi:ferric-dicitrate binding protein FerR (iron transport regulator)
MASTAPATVLQRLLEDDYVHEQITEASAGVRDAYRRVRRLPPEKAVQDKKVYDRLRAAASGATLATRRALGKPEPKPKRRRLPALAVLVATVAVVVWASKRDTRRPAPAPVADAPPVAPA